MLFLTTDNYIITEKIYESKNSTIYKGKRKSNNESVIAKTLSGDYPSPESLLHFKSEYELMTRINISGVIKVFEMEKLGDRPIFFMEEFVGLSLKEYIKREKIYLEEFIDIAIKVLRILKQIHAKNIIHKDINPANILFNPETRQLKIIDFGIATELLKENPSAISSDLLEGTVYYISPEQSGRMNRTIDYRSDFYSLGVSFYQILTSVLPFNSHDTLEIIHSHIAKKPELPHEIDNRIPEVISSIILKLMAKDAEDRYQTCDGILYDLEECWKRLKNSGEIKTFPIAQKDFSNKLHIPEKLYGRAKEVTQIMKTFHSATKGNAKVLLVSGRSGIGKSALVGEIHKPVLEYRGYFIAGKYDQYKRNTPYRAIIQAFQNILNQILSESYESLAAWKSRLELALGNNGKVITDIIPELELLIGKQPIVPELSPGDSQNRFELVFQNFLHALCDVTHPIALFLDDMQWADLPSINLIKSIILNPDSKYLLIILSYRDNEVMPTHPFYSALEDIKKNGLDIKHILLNPLSLFDVNHLISDTLSSNKADTSDLAEVIHLKTGGNPFFVNEVFKNLNEKNLILAPNSKEENARWSWDIEKIKEVKMADNVIELMVEKIEKMADSRIMILKLAACIGNNFRMDVFAKVLGIPEKDSNLELAFLANEGFFLLGDNQARFVHDKIREATYTLITEEQRVQNHYKIGSVFLKLAGDEKSEEYLFTIVNQLNQGRTLLKEEEKERFIALNILAGNKSLASGAYEAAEKFFQIVEETLPSDHWESNYKESLDICSKKALAEYLATNYESAEFTFAVILRYAKTTLDKISILEIKIMLYTSQGKMREALDIAAEALSVLKVSLPANPNELSPLPEILKIKIKLRNKSIQSLLNLPILKNQEQLSIMRLLNACFAPAYISKPALFPVVALKMVNSTLRYGITPISPFAFAAFAMIQGSALGDFALGYELGKLAIDMVDKYKFDAVKCRVYFLFAFTVNHFKHHACTNQKYLSEGIQSGMENGDILYAAYCVNHIVFQSFSMRQNLALVSEKFEQYRPIHVKLRQDDILDMFTLVEQATYNLRGLSSDIFMLCGKVFDERITVPKWIESINSTTLNAYYLMKIIIEYLFGDKNKVVEYEALAVVHENGNFGTLFIPDHVFFESLALCHLYEEFLKLDQKKDNNNYLQRIKKNQKRMKKWAESCPANFGHKYYIIEAEVHSITDERIEALRAFEKGIELAKEHEYLLEEAIGNELCAKFWMKNKREKYAKIHITEAHYAYKKWGCLPKVQKLEDEFPYLQSITNPKDNDISFSTVHLTASSTSSNALDVKTVLKASQAISGEIVLDKLLSRIMKFVIENAGAQKGYLLLPYDDMLKIEAFGEIASEIKVLQAIPLNSDEYLPEAIVNYVFRTKEPLVIADASRYAMFATNEYVTKKSIRSILCLPILNQGKLIAILYLENNLTTGAFTPDRVEILNILASQAAISMENAKLYQNMLKLNQSYERFVPSQFLTLLGKEHVTDVRLGDQIQKEMSILFSDIRSFTELSEKMSPVENFNFLNSYLKMMTPCVLSNNGFIDKYIGDAIMALFPLSAEDALKAAIEMQKQVRAYNHKQLRKNLDPISIGIGIHTGNLMLGTIGSEDRMEGTVISDAVNLASRMEGLTKQYGAAILISQDTLMKIHDPGNYNFRVLDRVRVKGKKDTVSVIEVIDGQPDFIIELFNQTKPDFERGVHSYLMHDLVKAREYFMKVLVSNRNDKAASIYLQRTDYLLANGIPPEWEGIIDYDTK